MRSAPGYSLDLIHATGNSVSEGLCMRCDETAASDLTSLTTLMNGYASNFCYQCFGEFTRFGVAG